MKNAARVKQEERVNFPILIDTPDNAVRNAYRGWANGIFVLNKDGVLVFRSSWTHGPELAQVLYDLYAGEKAQARNELVRISYSERLVGLLRNKKISASVHRRAGHQAARDFARFLKAEGKIGSAKKVGVRDWLQHLAAQFNLLGQPEFFASAIDETEIDDFFDLDRSSHFGAFARQIDERLHGHRRNDRVLGKHTRDVLEDCFGHLAVAEFPTFHNHLDDLRLAAFVQEKSDAA